MSVLKDIVDIYANFFEFIKDILAKAKIPPWQFVLLYAPMILNFFELVFTLISPKPQLEGNYDENYECKVFKVHHSNDIEKIFCTYSEGNKKSKRVIEKIGFEPYKVIKDAWEKDGLMISDYKNIITKQKFYELYCKDIKT